MDQFDACMGYGWARTSVECQWLSAVREHRLTAWSVGLRSGLHIWSDETQAILDAPGGAGTVAAGIEMFVPESRIILIAAFAEAGAKGTPYDLELLVVTFTGRIKRVRSRAVPLVAGGVIIAIAGAFEELI